MPSDRDETDRLRLQVGGFPTYPSKRESLLLRLVATLVCCTWFKREEEAVAQEVEFGKGGEGKIRSFWVGLGLTVLTIGIYGFCWYYFMNDELKDVGIAKQDQNLGQSSPAMSVTALVVGGWAVIPPLLSVYNFGQRIRRAQRLTGVPKSEQINPTTAFLLYFPGGILIVPLFFHFWYVTKHQNMALRAAGGLPYSGDITHTVAGPA